SDNYSVAIQISVLPEPSLTSLQPVAGSSSTSGVHSSNRMTVKKSTLSNGIRRARSCQLPRRHPHKTRCSFKRSASSTSLELGGRELSPTHSRCLLQAEPNPYRNGESVAAKTCLCDHAQCLAAAIK